MKWFRTFLIELNTDREYQQTFDRSLALLFGGFPDDLLRKKSERPSAAATSTASRASLSRLGGVHYGCEG
jgi:hypothetical protein